MKCKRAKSEIALWVGNDLDENDEQQVARHVARCPQCRDHATELKASLQFLQRPSDDQAIAPQGSIWPAMTAKLAAVDASRHMDRFNGWVPALTVAAACLAIVLLLDRSGPRDEQQPRPVLPTVRYPVNAAPRVEQVKWNPYRFATDQQVVFPQHPLWFPREVEPIREPLSLFVR